MASREIMKIPGLTLFLQIEGPLRLIVGDGPKAECAHAQQTVKSRIFATLYEISLVLPEMLPGKDNVGRKEFPDAHLLVCQACSQRREVPQFWPPDRLKISAKKHDTV